MALWMKSRSFKMLATYTDLKDKKILVTGATRGIGRALAESLASQGAHVIFNFREGKEAQAEELQVKLKELGASEATPLKFDVTDTAAMKEALENFVKEVGAITGVVNNAGISKDTLVLRLKEDELQQVLDTNLKGAIMLTQILSRSFLRAEDVSIVNIS